MDELQYENVNDLGDRRSPFANASNATILRLLDDGSKNIQQAIEILERQESDFPPETADGISMLRAMHSELNHETLHLFRLLLNLRTVSMNKGRRRTMERFDLNLCPSGKCNNTLVVKDDEARYCPACKRGFVKSDGKWWPTLLDEELMDANFI